MTIVIVTWKPRVVMRMRRLIQTSKVGVEWAGHNSAAITTSTQLVHQNPSILSSTRGTIMKILTEWRP